MFSLRQTTLAGLCALAAVSNANAAPIVTNGAFDGMSGWTVTGSGTTPGIGVTSITTGGLNSTGYGDNVPNYLTNTHAAFFVDDNANETISQHITLQAHTSYTLSFGLFATASGAANPFSFTLTDFLNPNLTLITSLTNEVGTTQVPVGVWTTETTTFITGSGTDYNLAFNFISGPTPAKDVLLSGVSVPEPASIALLGVGMISTGLMVRRRRQNSTTPVAG